MNLKTEILALAIRYLSGKTTLIHKPDPFTEFFGAILGEESYDRRLAKEIVSEADRAKNALKRKTIDKNVHTITDL